MQRARAKLKSLKSIYKITSSMKTISAAKYHHAERETNQLRVCGRAVSSFYDRIEVMLPPTVASKSLYVAITSDRGLCGACNTQVCHFIKHDLEKEESKSSSVMCVGVVGMNIFKYYHPDLIVLTADKLGKTLPSFLEASEIALQIIKLEDEFNHSKIVYNEYVNISSFITQQLSVYNTAVVFTTPKLIIYGNVLLETIQAYLEFALAMVLFYIIRASYTSEQGARFRAMVNATNNVDALQKKLTIINYKARQAAITSELTEIVAAAAAQETRK